MPSNSAINSIQDLKRMAVRIVLFYVVFSATWILLSDIILNHLISDSKLFALAQTFKGWIFVGLTGILFYFYLKKCLEKVHSAERKEQEKSDRQFNQMALLFDSFNAVIYIADMRTHELLYVNQYAADIFGPDWRQKTCFSYLQENMESPCGFCTNPQLHRQGETGPAIVWEFQNSRNHRWYECLDKAIRWNDGRLVRLEIAIDITERKELEKTKDDLLSAVSHEMRTPLTAITGFAELLLGDDQIPEHSKNQLKIIFNEAEKMTELVNTFLDLRRFKTDRARVDYEELEAEHIFRLAMKNCRECKNSHDIRISCEKNCVIFGNRKELVQAFGQLIANACRFSPSGGLIAVSGYQQGNDVILSVADNGIGISSEQQAKIFDNFFRIDTGDSRRTGGIGLGLALVKEIIELHGGRIWLESSPGKGSCFFTSLPRYGSGETVRANPMQAGEHPHG